MKDWVRSYRWMIFPILFACFLVFDEVIDNMEGVRDASSWVERWNVGLFLFKYLFYLCFSAGLILLFSHWRPTRLLLLKHLLVGLSVTVVLSLCIEFVFQPLLDGMDCEGVHESAASWIYKLFLLSFTIFMMSLRYQLVLENEEVERNYIKLQNESLRSQLAALNNQINPHFFFNALNSLGGLIAGADRERALAYLSNLSALFRYILSSQRREWVTLQEELAFLDKYQYMLTVKYGMRLVVEREIEPDTLDLCLPTLSLLPLVENVCRHNEISRRFPMRITLKTASRRLYVSNPKHPLLDEVERHGIGLQNLSQRYRLQVGEPIQILDNEDSFSVILPLMSDSKMALSCKS